jgi:multiple sugar transport system substrate-binding protein
MIRRRRLLGASAAAAALPKFALAQNKPDKLVFVGDNGPWHWCLVEEVAPAFEKATGIKVDFTLLPIDALSARLKAELNSGSSGIDIIQWTATYAGWLAQHMEDHQKLLAGSAGKHSDFDWDDFLPPIQDMASYQGKLLGIPYRVTASVLNYQKQLLADVGFAKAPETWAEFQAACIATTKAGAPNRYGLGIWGRQGPAMVGGFSPFLRGNGGRYFDPKTWEVLINNDRAVEALQYYGDLMTKYKVVVPDAITWEFDEIVAGGQNDRYAMTITLAPYGTLINDPKLSKTAGRWGWAVAPGAHSRDESRVSVGGWTFGVPSACRNKEWAFEVHPVCHQQGVDAPLDRTRQRAAARIGAERAGRAGALRMGTGACRSDEDRNARAARRDLADDGIAAAQRNLAGAAGTEDRKGSAGCSRGRLAA